MFYKNALEVGFHIQCCSGSYVLNRTRRLAKFFWYWHLTLSEIWTANRMENGKAPTRNFFQLLLFENPCLNRLTSKKSITGAKTVYGSRFCLLILVSDFELRAVLWRNQEPEGKGICHRFCRLPPGSVAIVFTIQYGLVWRWTPVKNSAWKSRYFLEYSMFGGAFRRLEKRARQCFGETARGRYKKSR